MMIATYGKIAIGIRAWRSKRQVLYLRRLGAKAFQPNSIPASKDFPHLVISEARILAELRGQCLSRTGSPAAQALPVNLRLQQTCMDFSNLLVMLFPM
jgi:hypothetical protein